MSSLLIFIAALLWLWSLSSALPDKKLYIVYLGAKQSVSEDLKPLNVYHHVLLSSLMGSEEATNAMVYSYSENFSGFAATLTARDAATLSRLSGVLSVFPSRMRHLHTTRSWEFLGVTTQNNGSSSGGDVVIGVFDTGVWPESESFNDHSFGPVPSRWKGDCAASIRCNRKLIGARFYSKGYEKEYGPLAGKKTPRDTHGHGTHTASIAAGSPVEGANFFGLAKGVARGGAPGARLAIYKVCWGMECSDADVLAAFDDALSDGVDVLSISLGQEPMDYFKDAVAIGGFHAMQKGVLTVVSAGNEGPSLHAAKNIAPWLFTVAASTIDRKFTTQILLGNGSSYKGTSINGFATRDSWHSLVFAGSVGDGPKSKFCGKGTLHSAKIKDKIVVCYGDDYRPDESVLLAGGGGLIYVLAEEVDTKEAFSFSVPATVVNKGDGKQVLAYTNSTRNPIARFLPTIVRTGEEIKATVALFSSRGPNLITPDILKPDIVAPGVDILAAWSPRGPVAGVKEDKRVANFNIISGTSMACPHVSGAVSLVKSFHPEWSPAALKSALMTTVLDQKHKFNRHGALAYGSGQINPVAATDPGLIYDISARDYANFLCNINYNATQIHVMLAMTKFRCSKSQAPVNSLNYPSIALGDLELGHLNVSITRRVTNVGSPNATYHAAVKHPGGRVRVTVTPRTLRFSSTGQRKSFRVELFATRIPRDKFLEGSWEWRDGKHIVRSPILVWRKH
ncbi:cucumisin isoform X2 [Selaginella moellendorffii]|uniref:cucumisin isoform X2 n=1 Tax=Selaginella moellendorffii TaxID=88036 RepID=UPI000D1C6640|nr:cucumisin isoform X2 [Selaginella moellendorffii]|eukprot:XP_024532727.1 cucumisin isoform X2 [Selaginella moellendorffii]